jgi:hypothetical protein
MGSWYQEGKKYFHPVSYQYTIIMNVIWSQSYVFSHGGMFLLTPDDLSFILLHLYVYTMMPAGLSTVLNHKQWKEYNDAPH